MVEISEIQFDHFPELVSAISSNRQRRRHRLWFTSALILRTTVCRSHATTTTTVGNNAEEVARRVTVRVGQMRSHRQIGVVVSSARQWTTTTSAEIVAGKWHFWHISRKHSQSTHKIGKKFTLNINLSRQQIQIEFNF